MRCQTGLILLCMAISQIATGEECGMNKVDQLQDFNVVELRRYAIKAGQRERFASYFESFFPEAFQQLGAIAFGQFTDRERADEFTWMRGFQSMESRAIANSAFYYGPVWKEHRTATNAMIDDSDNVLLLRPIDAEHRIPVLTAVTPDEHDGSSGLIAVQIARIEKGKVDAAIALVKDSLSHAASDGLCPAGVLVTLDAANNFPQLPVREDGPYLVWIAVVRDTEVLEHEWRPKSQSVVEKLTAQHLTRSSPEQLVLKPTHRSRLRWRS